MDSLVVDGALKDCLSELTLSKLIDVKKYNIGLIASKLDTIEHLFFEKDYKTLYAFHYELDVTLKICEKELAKKQPILKDIESKSIKEVLDSLDKYFPDAKGYSKDFLNLIHDMKTITSDSISKAVNDEIEVDLKTINSFNILKMIVMDVLDSLNPESFYII